MVLVASTWAQTSVALAPLTRFSASDGAGIPLVGGKLCTYQAGTTTPLATYNESTGSTPNTNPIVLDASGQGDVWLATGSSYKLVLRDATGADGTCNTGAIIWTRDNITSLPQNLTITGTFKAKWVDGRRMCDVPAAANAGIQLAACLADVNTAGGGVADATGIMGAQTVNQDICNGYAYSSKITLLLGPAAFSVSVPQLCGANFYVRGAGKYLTVWQTTTATTSGNGETTGDAFRIGGNNGGFSDMSILGAAGVNPSFSTNQGSKAFIWHGSTGTGSNWIFSNLEVGQFDCRPFQIGSSPTQVVIQYTSIHDFACEGPLVSPGAETKFLYNDITRVRSWCIDSNSSDTTMIGNVCHDGNDPQGAQLANAGGFSITALSGTMNNIVVQGNKCKALFAGVFGCIGLNASDGTTLSAFSVNGNTCTDSAAAQFFVFLQPIGSLLNGVITNGSVSSNNGENCKFYTKQISQVAYTGNTTRCTLGAGICNTEGMRWDTTAAIVVTGNSSNGWATGAQTGCSNCAIAINYFSGTTIDFSNNNTAPYLAWNVTPNIATLNGVLNIPETNNVLAGKAGMDFLGGLTGHQLGVNPNNAGTTTVPQANNQLTLFSTGNSCSNGELVLSAGWQSTGSATVTAASGSGEFCSWTITTGTTTAANPTITDTLVNPLSAATSVCWMNIYGGTHTAVAGESLRQTTLSATVPVFTANFTPTAGGTTYFVTRGCGT